MKKFSISFVLMFFIDALSAQSVQSCKPCEELMNLQLPDVTILVAEAKASDSIKNANEPLDPDRYNKQTILPCARQDKQGNKF